MEFLRPFTGIFGAIFMISALLSMVLYGARVHNTDSVETHLLIAMSSTGAITGLLAVYFILVP